MSADVCVNVRQAVYEKVLQRSTPGPAAYPHHSRKVTVSSLKPEAPHWSIPGANRSANAATAGPGPHGYQDPLALSTVRAHQPEGRIADIPAWSFGGGPARGLYGLGPGPGPGAYDVRSSSAAVKTRSARSVFGTSSRAPPTAAAPRTPGPGAYGDPLHAHQAHGEQPRSDRPTAQRQPLARAARGDPAGRGSLGPGPAAYRTEVWDGVSGRPVSSMRPRSATTAIGRAPRPSALLPSVDTPGPGSYRPALSAVLPGPALGRIGREARGGPAASSAHGGTPGPAAHVQRKLDSTSNHPAAPRARFGSSARFHPQGGDSGPGPGPAAYQTQEGLGALSTRPASAAWGFGTSAARPDMSGGSAPGPADYQSLSSRGRSLDPRGPVFGQQAREVSAPGQGPHAARMPGPADYRPSISPLSTVPTAPRARVGSASRAQGGVLGAGAGKYYLAHEDLAVDHAVTSLPTQPRQRLGKSRRWGHASQGQGTPGPDQYGYTFRQDSFRAQGWTIRAR